MRLIWIGCDCIQSEVANSSKTRNQCIHFLHTLLKKCYNATHWDDVLGNRSSHQCRFARVCTVFFVKIYTKFYTKSFCESLKSTRSLKFNPAHFYEWDEHWYRYPCLMKKPNRKCVLKCTLTVLIESPCVKIKLRTVKPLFPAWSSNSYIYK